MESKENSAQRKTYRDECQHIKRRSQINSKILHLSHQKKFTPKLSRERRAGETQNYQKDRIKIRVDINKQTKKITRKWKESMKLKVYSLKRSKRFLTNFKLG